MAQTVRSGQYP